MVTEDLSGRHFVHTCKANCVVFNNHLPFSFFAARSSHGRVSCGTNDVKNADSVWKVRKRKYFWQIPPLFFFSWKQNKLFNLNFSIKSISSIHHENVSKNIEWKTVFIYLMIFFFTKLLSVRLEVRSAGGKIFALKSWVSRDTFQTFLRLMSCAFSSNAKICLFLSVPDIKKWVGWNKVA